MAAITAPGAASELARSLVAEAVRSVSSSLEVSQKPQAVPRGAGPRPSAELTGAEAAEVMSRCGVRTTCGAEDRALLAAAEAGEVGPRPRPTAMERLRMAEAAGFTVSEESWPAARRRSMPPRIIRQDSGVKITARGRASVPPPQRTQRSSLPCGTTPMPRPTAIERLAIAQQLGYTVQDQQFAAARKSLVDNNCFAHQSELSPSASTDNARAVDVDHVETELLSDSFAPFVVPDHVDGVEYAARTKPRKTLSKRVSSKASKVFGRLSRAAGGLRTGRRPSMCT